MKNSTPLMVLTILLIIVFVTSIIAYLSKTAFENSAKLPTVTPTITEAIATTEIAEHNLQLGIISPEEDIILKRQARMYEALVTGNAKLNGARINCNWKFFLNENNEEVLYKEMNNSSIMDGASKEVCGFTSTFIEKPGKLRVQLNLTFANAVSDNLETISTERFYTVQ